MTVDVKMEDTANNLPVPMIKVVAAPFPFKNETVVTHVPIGSTISDIVGRAKRDNIEVWIDGTYVEHVEWDTVTPNPGNLVNIKVLPGRGILRAALLLAVVVATSFIVPELAPQAAAAVAAGTATALQTLTVSLLTTGLTIAGALLVNALIPPAIGPSGNEDQFTRLASLTGVRNNLAAFSPIPRLYGRMKYFPPVPMTATPFTELVGDFQYLRAMFVLGYGPLDIGGVKVGGGSSATLKQFPTELGDNIKIGETKISEFEDVELEIGEFQDITLYSNTVNQQTLAVVMNSATQAPKTTVTDNISEIRTTGVGAEEISIDIEFPNGLFSFDKKGRAVASSVSFKVEYRLTGTSDPWQSATSTTNIDEPGSSLFWYRSWFNTNSATLQTELPSSFSDPFFVIRSSERKTLRRSLRWKVPSGQYDVRITRQQTFNSGDSLGTTDATWIALRDSKPTKPFVVPGVVLMAMRIKATDELSGALDNVSVLATSILSVWNGTAWVESATRTPAWAYVDVLTGSATRNPIDRDNEIDKTAIKNWADWTDLNGFYFDHVYDSNGTVFNRIRDITAAGRAAWAFQDNLFSVVREETGQTPLQVFTPRNTSGFSFQKLFPQIPDALRVQFIDDTTYEDTERLVFNDGFDENNSSIFQELQLRGVTDKDQAWKLARFHLGQLKLRPEIYRFSVPIENLIIQRGDAATLQHDILLVGQAAGRITSVTRDASNQVTSFVSDQELSMTTGTNYGIKVRYINSSGQLDIFSTQIQTVDPSTTTVTPINPLPAEVDVGDLFVHGIFGSESIDVKVIKIDPAEDLTAVVTAVPLSPSLLTIDSGPIPSFTPFLSKPIDPTSRVPPIPTILSLRSDEKALIRDIDGSLRVRVLVGFSVGSEEGNPNITVEARYTNINVPQSWKRVTTRGDSREIALIEEIEEGETYEIQLRSIRGGVASKWTTSVTHLVIGKSSPPADVLNFTSNVKDFGIVLTWDKNEELDVEGYEIREGVDWASGSLVTETKDTKFIVDLDPAKTSRTFWIKAFDVAGNFSTNAVSVTATTGLPTITGFTSSFDGPNLNLTWTGNKGNHPIEEFDIRKDGTTFANATQVTKVKGESFSIRADWSGSKTWRIAAIDVMGNVGTDVSTVATVTLPSISTVTATAVSNTVVLQWTTTIGTLPIQEYEIRKGSVFSTATVLGRATGTKTTIIENSGGSFVYWVVPFDTGGNQGTEKSTTATTVLNPIIDAGDLPFASGGFVEDIRLSGVNNGLDLIGDGSTFFRVKGTSLTTGEVDLSKSGVLNKTADNIAESASRKWAAESGADVTSPRLHAVLINGDFSLGTTEGWANTPNVRSVTGAPTSFVGFVAAATGGPNMIHVKKIPVQPGDRVAIWMQARAVGTPDADATLAVRKNPGFSRSAPVATVTSGTTAWTTYRGIYTVESGVESIQIDFGEANGTTGEYEFTNVQYAILPRDTSDIQFPSGETVTDLKPAEADADVTDNAGGVTVFNPNFEQGDVQWGNRPAQVSVVNDPANAWDGNWVMKFDANGAVSWNTKNAKQNPTAPGDVWLQTCMVKGGTGGGSVSAVPIFRKADGTAATPSTGTVISETTATAPITGWTLLRRVVAAPADAATIEAGISSSSTVTGTFYADKFTLVRLPADTDEIRFPSGEQVTDLTQAGAGKGIDLLGDGATYRRTTISEADGAGRAANALVSNNTLASTVRYQESSNTREITRGVAPSTGVDGQSFTFNPSRATIPSIRQRPGGEYGVPDPSGSVSGKHWYKVISAANATTAGFDLVARFEAVTSGSPTQITDTGATGSTGTVGSLVIVKSQTDEAFDDKYTVQFDLTVGAATEETGLPGETFIIPSLIEIAVDTRPAGGVWTERTSKVFSNSDTASSLTLLNETLTVTVDGLGLNAEVRVRVKTNDSINQGTLDAYDSLKYSTPGTQVTVSEAMTGGGRTLSFDVIDGEEDTIQ